MGTGTKESFWGAVNFVFLDLGGSHNSVFTFCVYYTSIKIFVYKNLRL